MAFDNNLGRVGWSIRCYPDIHYYLHARANRIVHGYPKSPYGRTLICRQVGGVLNNPRCRYRTGGRIRPPAAPRVTERPFSGLYPGAQEHAGTAPGALPAGPALPGPAAGRDMYPKQVRAACSGQILPGSCASQVINTRRYGSQRMACAGEKSINGRRAATPGLPVLVPVLRRRTRYACPAACGTSPGWGA